MESEKGSPIKNIINTAKKALPIRQSLLIGVLLGIVGGFLDAYTFVLRGGVFANAQTGNMVLLAINIVNKDLTKVRYYFIPIFAFFLGVIITEILKKYYDKTKRIRHEYIVLFSEVILLFIVGFIPTTTNHIIANVIISFICSMQVNSFRALDGRPYATTMCTGNLRSGAENFFKFISNKDKNAGEICVKYFIIIIFFCMGAALGVMFAEKFGIKSIWACCILLIITIIILIDEQKRNQNIN